MIEPGETFTGFDFGNHLFIVISREQSDGLIAVANLTTHGREPRCRRGDCVIVSRDDHPWVRHDSCIPYRRADMTPAKPLADAKQRGTLELQEPASPELLLRIQRGALEFRRIQNPVRAAVRDTLGESR